MALALAICAAGLASRPPRAPPLLRARAPRLTESAAEADGERWVRTPSGLRFVDLVVGAGELPEKGAVVKVHYTGTLASDGSEFDSSKGRAPFAFAIGTGTVIPGWDEGIASMRVGGRRRLNIPYQLAYGEEGSGPIPPKADLIFDCELVGTETGMGAFISTFPGGLPNFALICVLGLSFIPYFFPPDMVPEFWRFK